MNGWAFRRPVFLGLILVVGALAAAPAAAQGPLNFDEDILRVGGIGKDNTSLLDYFRHLSPEGVDPANLEPLIQRMKSKRFAERERAGRALIHQGVRALPVLRKALKSPDIELVRRARACIDAIEKPDPGLNVVPAAVRALVKRRVPGAVAVLLRYLPFAPAESLEEDVVFGLDDLARQAGKMEPALLAALKDRLAPRRAAAACIVGHRGNAEQKAAVRKLLTDASPLVRLRAAQGLLAAGDGVGLTMLATLVAEADVPLAWQAEELLHWVAGDQSPKEIVGAGSAEARRKCRTAWEAWCKKHAAAVDFAELRRQPRWPVLLAVLQAELKGKGERAVQTGVQQVAVLGCDGRERWKLGFLPPHGPTWFQWGARGRSVVTSGQVREEDPLGVVSEFDLHGKRLWSTKEASWGSAPLWNGGKLLVGEAGRFYVRGPTGKEGWSLKNTGPFPGSYRFYLLKAWPLGNRQLLSLCGEGLGANSQQIHRIVLLDVGTGEGVKRGKIAAHTVIGGVLPDGNVRLVAFRSVRLKGPIPEYRSFVEEIDLDGNVVKQWSERIYPCARFRNGNDVTVHTLV